MTANTPRLMAKGSSDYSSYVLPVGLLILGWKVYDHFFGTKADPGGTVTTDPRPRTLDDATVKVYADAIDVAVWGSGVVGQAWEDEGVVVSVMTSAQNTADVVAIQNAYGYRGLVLSPLDLTQTIVAYLSADDIAQINNDYQAKHITIQF